MFHPVEGIDEFLEVSEDKYQILSSGTDCFSKPTFIFSSYFIHTAFIPILIKCNQIKDAFFSVRIFYFNKIFILKSF